MKKSSILAALFLAGCVSDGPPPAPQPTKEELVCTASGLIAGTPEYAQCLAMAKLSEDAFADYKKEEKERKTIGDGLALQICEDYARKHMREKILSRNPFSKIDGDYEKTVQVSFSIDKSAEDPNILSANKYVTCKLRGRQIVDFFDTYG